MKRRSLLKMFGAMGVMGPQGAAAVAAPGLEALVVGSSIASEVPRPESHFADRGYAENDHYNPLKDARDELAEILGMTRDEMQRWREEFQVTRLDPDLAACRSFSLSFKIARQIERDMRRARDRRIGSLQRRIAQLVLNGHA